MFGLLTPALLSDQSFTRITGKQSQAEAKTDHRSRTGGGEITAVSQQLAGTAGWISPRWSLHWVDISYSDLCGVLTTLGDPVTRVCPQLRPTTTLTATTTPVSLSTQLISREIRSPVSCPARIIFTLVPRGLRNQKDRKVRKRIQSFLWRTNLQRCIL